MITILMNYYGEDDHVNPHTYLLRENETVEGLLLRMVAMEQSQGRSGDLGSMCIRIGGATPAMDCGGH